MSAKGEVVREERGEAQMKKWMAGIGIVVVMILALTKSLYLGWTEWIVVIAAAVVITILVTKDANNGRMAVLYSVVGAFALFWLLSLADLAIDHLIYYFSTGVEDGRGLTLAEKIREFSDDLLLLSFISPVIAGFYRIRPKLFTC